MILQRLKPHRDQQPLLDACTTSRPPLAPAAHLSRRRDRDRRIGFADVAALPDPEWATSKRPGRFEVAGLVPAGHLLPLPLPLRNPAEDPKPIAALLADATQRMRERDAAFEAAMADEHDASAQRYADLAAATWVDEAIGRLIAEKVRSVLDAIAARPELRHDHALLMALAPVVAMLKGSVA